MEGRERTQYGDYQTPLPLARRVVAVLARLGVKPGAVLEPSCGRGNFLVAAAECLEGCRLYAGMDIDPDHLETARRALGDKVPRSRLRLSVGDFFKTDWPAELATLPRPVLVLGNPPWATSAGLSVLGSRNLPPKSNFQHRRGLEARTGKSNFDISEWMLVKLLESLDARHAVLAMLCKTAVARRVLAHAWSSGLPIARAELRGLDARESFGVAVDACLLVVWTGARGPREAGVHASLEASVPERRLAWRSGMLVSDVEAFEAWAHLSGRSPYRWRSGIKHDAARVMELVREDGVLRNGLGEPVELEALSLFPMRKGADLGHPRSRWRSRWMVVPQTFVSEDTAALARLAPRTWRYLQAHGAQLDRRASSIYRGRSRFAIFGVGPYSFSPWKVATAGFSRKLHFVQLGPAEGQPVVLDDTCCFVPCATREEARFVGTLLASEPARAFLGSLVCWDTKRPLTTELLNRLDLRVLARTPGQAERFERVTHYSDW